MRFVQTLLALALAGAAASAAAVPVGPGYIGNLVNADVAITNSHGNNVVFADVYSFDIETFLSEAIATSVRVVLSFNDGPAIYNIEDFKIELKDTDGFSYATDVVPDSLGNYSLAAYLNPSAAGAPGFYQFIVSGKATGTAGGLYAGALSAQPVPEAETYAMMLAGLGLVGFLVSRRRGSL